MSKILKILLFPLFVLSAIFATIGKLLWSIHPYLNADDYSEFCDGLL